MMATKPPAPHASRGARKRCKKHLGSTYQRSGRREEEESVTFEPSAIKGYTLGMTFVWQGDALSAKNRTRTSGECSFEKGSEARKNGLSVTLATCSTMLCQPCHCRRHNCTINLHNSSCNIANLTSNLFPDCNKDLGRLNSPDIF